MYGYTASNDSTVKYNLVLSNTPISCYRGKKDTGKYGNSRDSHTTYSACNTLLSFSLLRTFAAKKQCEEESSDKLKINDVILQHNISIYPIKYKEQIYMVSLVIEHLFLDL